MRIKRAHVCIIIVIVFVLIGIIATKHRKEGYAGEDRSETSPMLLSPPKEMRRRIIDAENSGKSSEEYIFPSNYDLIAMQDWAEIGYLQNDNKLKLELFINKNIDGTVTNNGQGIHAQYLIINEDMNFAQTLDFSFVIRGGEQIMIDEISTEPFTTYIGEKYITVR